MFAVIFMSEEKSTKHMRKMAYLDLGAIDDLIIKHDKTAVEVYEKAGLCKRTWHYIRKAGKTSVPNACGIAYAFNVHPEEIIVDIKLEACNETEEVNH